MEKNFFAYVGSKFCKKCQIKWQNNNEEREVSRWFLSFKQEFAFKYVLLTS